MLMPSPSSNPNFKKFKIKTHTFPSGVSKKQIGSNDALAHNIQDVIAACLLAESFDAILEYTCSKIAPDSKTITSSSSVSVGICLNGCGFFDKSPISIGTPASYAPQFTSGDLDPMKRNIVRVEIQYSTIQ
jgi:hypothetical protein